MRPDCSLAPPSVTSASKLTGTGRWGWGFGGAGETGTRRFVCACGASRFGAPDFNTAVSPCICAMCPGPGGAGGAAASATGGVGGGGAVIASNTVASPSLKAVSLVAATNLPPVAAAISDAASLAADGKPLD